MESKREVSRIIRHPWHGISPGRDAPEYVHGIVEIPKGSRAKYELDKDTGLIKMDRVLYSSVYYPANYGFIPQTYGEDHDPLDILVLSQIEITPMCIVDARVIGVMRMIDHGEADDKIIAVAEGDMSVNHINDITQLPTHFFRELRTFFEDYKKLEKKTVVIEEFQSKDLALEIITQGIKDYKKKFKEEKL